MIIRPFIIEGKRISMEKNNNHKKKNFALIALFILAYTIILSISYTIGANFSDVNVTTTVNITNAFPVITSINVDQNILLNAGSTKTVWCNITTYDWNGFGDIISVNATLWDNSTVTMTSADNNNTHYTNSSCTYNTTGAVYYANYSCAFTVWYYANATAPSQDWVCNATIMDTWNFTDAEYNTTAIQKYYALNVTPVIDYGNLAVGDYSDNVTANITNFGNMPINISVNGTAMNCTIAGYIPVNYQHFSINATQLYANKQVLSASMQNVTNLTVFKRINAMEWNTTYWQLYVPVSENPAGRCNGTITFTAVAG